MCLFGCSECWFPQIHGLSCVTRVADKSVRNNFYIVFLECPSNEVQSWTHVSWIKKEKRWYKTFGSQPINSDEKEKEKHNITRNCNAFCVARKPSKIVLSSIYKFFLKLLVLSHHSLVNIDTE